MRVVTTRDSAGEPCHFVDVIGRAKSSIKMGNGKWVHPEALEMALELDAAAKLIFTDAALGNDWLEARKSHLQGTWIARQEASRETAASPLQAALHVATLVVSLALITAPLLISAWHLWRGSGAPRPEPEPAGKQAARRKES